MARINKNGNLSGAIGNIVFVNDHGRQYGRSLPEQYDQTADSVAASQAFGTLSHIDKLYRIALGAKVDFRIYQYFAVRHKAALQRTAERAKDERNRGIPVFGNPDALVGFDFNDHLPWRKVCNFFPDYEQGDDGPMQIGIPNIKWGKEIKPPKNATQAQIRLSAITTNLNAASPAVELLSSITMVVDASEMAAAQDWTFSIPAVEGWVLILGDIEFWSPLDNIPKREQSTTTYLWARNIVS